MNVSQLSANKQSFIAAAVHVIEPEAFWPLPLGGKGSDIEHPYMYSWDEPMTSPAWGVPEEDDRGSIQSITSWYVAELRKAPQKLEDAELGWYIIESPWAQKDRAVDGPFKTWDAAAAVADGYGIRRHLHR